MPYKGPRPKTRGALREQFAVIRPCFNRERGRCKSVYQTQAARETVQGRGSVVGLDDGHGTRRSYSGAWIRENCGAVSGTAGRL